MMISWKVCETLRGNAGCLCSITGMGICTSVWVAGMYIYTSRVLIMSSYLLSSKETCHGWKENGGQTDGKRENNKVSSDDCSSSSIQRECKPICGAIQMTLRLVPVLMTLPILSSYACLAMHHSLHTTSLNLQPVCKRKYLFSALFISLFMFSFPVVHIVFCGMLHHLKDLY